ncbi:MAG: ABC transporter permease subunit [Eggerthellaceae bacterium]
MLIALVGVSVPIFWSGILLILLFAGILHVLPSSGRVSPLMQPYGGTGFFIIDTIMKGDMAALGDVLVHLILPTLALSLYSMAIITRMTRSSMLETLGEDYVRTARAKGLSKGSVNVKHALRNAMLPVSTVIGLQFGSLLGGALLTETVFAWPGIGKFAVDCVLKSDFPSSRASCLVAVIFVIMNLVVDIVYAYLDPRIKYGAKEEGDPHGEEQAARHGAGRRCRAAERPTGQEKHESIWKDVFAGIVSNRRARQRHLILILAAIAIVTKLAPGILPTTRTRRTSANRCWGPRRSTGSAPTSRAATSLPRARGHADHADRGPGRRAISLTVGVILGSIAGYKGGKGHRHHAHHGRCWPSPPSFWPSPSWRRSARHRKAVVAIGLVASPNTRASCARDPLHQGERLRGRRAVIGDSNFKIVFKHVLPNVLPSIIVRATLGISTAILDAAALGFLGLGVQPPAAEWGDMLAAGATSCSARLGS